MFGNALGFRLCDKIRINYFGKDGNLWTPYACCRNWSGFDISFTPEKRIWTGLLNAPVNLDAKCPSSFCTDYNMSSVNEIHEYIQNVLERGDHGPNRVMLCDAKTLDQALDHHAEGIGALTDNEHRFQVDPSHAQLNHSSLTTRN